MRSHVNFPDPKVNTHKTLMQLLWVAETYFMEFLKWSSAGFLTVQLFSNHRSASDGFSGERKTVTD